MKFFIDTHDRRSNTFPEQISAQQFSDFFAKYETACREEGVIVLRSHVGLEAGRAYCFNMAPSAEHIRRAHERAGLPFESITEVSTATPGDLFFQPRV
ncbi:MAG TPA: DUF4242 domain-containing protein [Polyangiaceae bacterium]|nr:DUF4242 domain-containing protein [Polyangiaceae bacterium]